MLNVYGMWVPANTRYYKKKKNAEDARNYLIKTTFKHPQLVKIVKVKTLE